MKSNKNNFESDNIRQKAEEILKERKAKKTSSFNQNNQLQLVHELEVHQIELELQNDELILANQKTKQAEEKYLELFDFAPFGYFILSKEGTILELNHNGAMILGKERANLINSQFSFFISEEVRNIFNIFFEKLFASNQKESCESIIYSNSQAPINVYLTGIVLENREHCLISIVDITERKQIEKDRIQKQNELQKLKNELEEKVIERTKELQEKIEILDQNKKSMQIMLDDLHKTSAELKEESEKLNLSNKALEAFSYSISHDLKAPLRAINCYSKFILDDYYDKIDDNGKRFIESIMLNAKKMHQLISDLLNLSRVSKTEMSFDLVDMSEIINSVFNEIATDIEKNEFEIVIDKIPKAFCDTSLITQVWKNLISNALKYSSKGENKKIEISAIESEQEIIYCIKDYGLGFDEKYVEKLFGVFQRLHNEIQFEGTGIGLAVVQRIIHRHHGRIWAKSEINKGASFYFSLPKKINN